MRLIHYILETLMKYRSVCVIVNVVDGEVLHIVKISRLHMGAYLCIASNDVPPRVSQRISLRVQCEYTEIFPHIFLK